MRITGVAVLSALLLAAAGCGGEDEPPALPPVTAPAVTTTPAAPTAAVSAFPETPQGAAAFARAFFLSVNQAFAKKSASYLAPFFAEGCTACARYEGTLRDLASGAASVESSELTVISAESPPAEGRLQPVDVRVASRGSVFRDPSGNVTNREPAGTAEIELRLVRDGTSWLIEQIINVSFESTP